MNLVQNRIDVAGTVNAIKDGRIGGNLYFISPNGMTTLQPGDHAVIVTAAGRLTRLDQILEGGK